MAGRSTGVLARVATVDTVDTEGMPHVVPCGWSFDPATEEVVLGGRDVLRTVRAAHVRATGRAAVVVDGLAPGPGWSPWAFIVPGRARIEEGDGTLRVACDRITSWGLAAVPDEHADARDTSGLSP